MRTSGLFDTRKYDIIDDRKKWGDILQKYPRIQIDPDFLTETLRRKIESFGVTISLKKSPIISERLIKTPIEIDILRTSQALNRQVYEKILPFLIPGVTEEGIAQKIQILQLELGASGPSFPPIVAF